VSSVLRPTTFDAEAKGPRALATLYDFPFIALRDETITIEAVKAMPVHVLTRARAIVYRVEDGRLKVAVTDPANVQMLDDLRIASRLPIDFAVAPANEIDAELRRLARGQEMRDRAATMGDNEGFRIVELETDLEAEDGVSDAPPIRLVTSIIAQASDENASDIHFLPQADALVARIRVDGMIQEVERIPKRHASGVVTRLKVLANLDIAEHRLPQDGRFSIRPRSTGRLVDVRVAVLPTVEGEGVIMRLLDTEQHAPSLTEIGLSNAMQMQFENAIYQPNGCVLVTGPTGSGKSTTVHAALVDIRRPEVNIVTIEDPVEYRVADVYQMQVNLRAGVTFASGLRSILRSDPDVVMVGEIRDVETAKITLEAALTGHSVLSTMHTNDSVGAVNRLIDLDVEPFVIASAVSAVVAQRLVRRLCVLCREAYTPSAPDLEFLGYPAESIEEGITLYRPTGCPDCTRGYRGRTGIYQLLVMNPEVASLVAARASYTEIFDAAVREGMRTIWADGLEKAAAGVTTIDELTRIVR
jgi:type IV pilus assembly protein PilB